MSDKREVKLSKSQIALYNNWMGEFRSIMDAVSRIASENISNRLEAMALELGVDVIGESWSFDNKKMAFVEKEKVIEVEEVIPSNDHRNVKKARVVKEAN
jgi:hypothetical protein